MKANINFKLKHSLFKPISIGSYSFLNMETECIDGGGGGGLQFILPQSNKLVCGKH